MPLEIPIGLLAGFHDACIMVASEISGTLFLVDTVEARLRHVCGHEDGVLFE